MRAMRVYSAPCAPVPPLRSPLSCLRASRHCLGGAWACCVCVCAHRARFARVPHCLGRLPPSPSVWGGDCLGFCTSLDFSPPLCLGGGTWACKAVCVCVCAFCARPPTPGAHSPPSPPCPQQAHSDAPLHPPPPRSPPLPGGACLRMLEAHLCVCSSCPGGGEKPYRRAPTYLKGGRGGALPPLCLGPARGCWRRTFARIMSCDARLAPPT
jgi:hypothetical protein